MKYVKNEEINAPIHSNHLYWDYKQQVHEWTPPFRSPTGCYA